MKRVGNLYETICSISNLKLADEKARKGKSKQKGVIEHDRNRENNIVNLHHILKNKEYHTSEYTIFTIKDPKEREIFRLPYYPDRIVHHAIMNVLEPIWLEVFTKNTYSCIKGRGIHGAFYNVKKAFKDKENTTYVLKLDIKKFYPTIDHDILKVILRKKIKDKDLLWLLDEIIDSTEGVPIGNYLSQYFANLYLAYFDHWLKEVKKIKYVFRYCDDIVIFHGDKNYLHTLRRDIELYLWENLKLKVKSNYQVFPIDKRGLDFVGYVFCGHDYILLRKSIKKKFKEMLHKRRNDKSIASYYGWIVHCNGINLFNKLTLI